MKRSCIAKTPLLALLVTGAICAFTPGIGAAFDNSSLLGAYGCLGKTTALDASGGRLVGYSELLHLYFNGAGNVKGVIILNESGEVCNITTTGTYKVKGGGLGTVDLSLNTASGDADGDTDCSSGFLDRGIVQHMAFLLESGGQSFDFQSADDFWTAPGADESGLLIDLQSPFVGSCKKQ